MSNISGQPHSCWICGKAVNLRNCKIDEYGSAVHEVCNLARIALENSTRKDPRSCRSVARSQGALVTRHGH